MVTDRIIPSTYGAIWIDREPEFKCHVCGTEDVLVAPDLFPGQTLQAICPGCCGQTVEGHNYGRYVLLRTCTTECTRCGQEPPLDWYGD